MLSDGVQVPALNRLRGDMDLVDRAEARCCLLLTVCVLLVSVWSI